MRLRWIITWRRKGIDYARSCSMRRIVKGRVLRSVIKSSYLIVKLLCSRMRNEE
jgi:hypothetical protein